MSVINSNGLTPGFTQSATPPAFSSATIPGSVTAPPSGRTDNIEASPYQTAAPADPYGPDPGAGYGANTGGFGTVYDRLLAALSSLFSNLGSMFGYGANGANGATPPGGSPVPQNGNRAQTFFTSATANSIGDPHESFDGTTGAGSTIDQKWNSMSSHPNLLDSDSFAGGYRVSTSVTPPNGAGITQNESASVTTNGGATTVTMRADGSYAVVSNGANLTLPTGRPQSLGNGETVTLNADSSLTLVDTNGRGGSITTTLKSNGTGGVDVTNDAKSVDLGGSLVGHAEYRADGSGSGSGASPAASPYANGFVAPPFASLGLGDPFVLPQPQSQPSPSLAIPYDGEFAIS